jgi:hypothetical protein
MFDAELDRDDKAAMEASAAETGAVPGMMHTQCCTQFVCCYAKFDDELLHLLRCSSEDCAAPAATVRCSLALA